MHVLDVLVPLLSTRPAPVDFEALEVSGAVVRSSALEAVDLSTAFDLVTDRNTLPFAKCDQHTTALGHRLLAEKLYERLVPMLFGSPSKQQASSLQKAVTIQQASAPGSSDRTGPGVG
jgi:hypothetical protein